MKILFYAVIGLFLIISLSLVVLSFSSRKQPDIGMINNQLRACPASPKCVSSERQIEELFVEPLLVTTAMDDAWSKARQAILESGGEIVTERGGYLHALFMTPFLRFIDDVELRIDENKQVIHIRSASRVGRSDMGANKSRVVKIRMAFHKSAGKG